MLIDHEQTRSTRDRVLRTLLTSQRCTINELATAVGINPISVRHHISRLEAEGLVNSEEERHGVGRPRRVYFLTEQGLELFPTRYVRLTMRLLETLKETLPPVLVERLFDRMAQDLAAEYQEGTENLSVEERMDLVTSLLSAEGFTVDWEQKGDEYLIHEANCPYYYLGQNHPEVCSVDEALISAVLSVPPERVRCMLHGDSHCTYVIPGIPHVNAEKLKQVEEQEA